MRPRERQGRCLRHQLPTFMKGVPIIAAFAVAAGIIPAAAGSAATAASQQASPSRICHRTRGSATR